MNPLIKLWNEFYSAVAGQDEAMHSPLSNAYLKNGKMNFEIAAPGHEEEDFIIAHNLEYNQISIRAKSTPRSAGGRIWIRREFDFNSFTRIFQLERKIDPNGIKKDYRSGILYLEYPVLSDIKSDIAI